MKTRTMAVVVAACALVLWACGGAAGPNEESAAAKGDCACPSSTGWINGVLQ